MKRAVFSALLILIVVSLTPVHAQASLRLFVGESEVELRNPLTMVSGNFMIPVWVLEKHLGAEIHTEAGNIAAVFPDQTILMQLGEESAQVDGQIRRLDAAPLSKAGEILVPLRFIADQRRLNLVFEAESMALYLRKPVLPCAPPFQAEAPLPPEAEPPPEEKLELLPEKKPRPLFKEPVVVESPKVRQDLREIIFMGGPRSRVFIDLDTYSDYQTSLLTDPDRVMIDLFGVEGDALQAIEVEDALVRRIRSSRFDDQTIRIVFDLKNSTGYTVTPWPEGGLEVEFNYLLADLGLEKQNGFFQLWFEGSALPPADVAYLENPLRLMLDFRNTSLLSGAKDILVNEGRIYRLRANQHSPSTARVVLELTDFVAPLSWFERHEGHFVLPLFAGTPRAAQEYLDRQRFAQPAAVPQEPETGSEAEPEASPRGVLEGLIIAVDPGHGGSDPGTIGYQGTFEKDITLAISRYLGENLVQAGAEVIYTRESDFYVSIFERPEIAIEANAHLFISIHVNSHLKRGAARGTETLYRAGDPVSEKFAQSVQEELVKAITLIDRRIWPRDDLAVFNGSEIPAILVEVGFLDHPEEEVLLRAPGFQRVAAAGIFNGIERFWSESKGWDEGQ